MRTLSGENSNTNNSMPKMSSCVFVHKEEICVKERAVRRRRVVPPKN